MIPATNPAWKMDRIFGQNLVQHIKTLTYIVFQHAIKNFHTDNGYIKHTKAYIHIFGIHNDYIIDMDQCCH